MTSEPRTLVHLHLLVAKTARIHVRHAVYMEIVCVALQPNNLDFFFCCSSGVATLGHAGARALATSGRAPPAQR